MKLLIGVLYSGESQREACIQAIENQTYKNWEIFEIHNLPKKEAHEKLFGTFSDRSNDVDLFIKIDADMELCHNDFFSELVAFINQNPAAELLTIKVDDFFTGRHIWGMNIYRSSINFGENDAVNTDIFFDKENAPNIIRLKKHRTLVPAARHGYNPTDYQLFHFGCHKAIKVMHRYSRAHMRNIRSLLWTALLKRDYRHLIAYAGAATAFEHKMEPEYFDHGNGLLEKLFEETVKKDKKFWKTNLMKNFFINSKASRQLKSNT